jgi:excisionase family DNA binding protein
MAARKFLDIDEAAALLGVTADTLGEMRDRREIHGYRDGANWKFKAEDIERLKAERAAADDEGEFAELDEDPDSILLSEVELGQSGESTSSTIIGARPSAKDALDSDIQLAQPKHDSDVNLDEALVTEDKGGSDVLQAGSGVSPLFDELDNLDLEMDSAADSGISSKIVEGSGGSSPILEELTAGGSSPDVTADAGTSDITLGSDALKLEGSGLSFGEDEQLALSEEPGLELEGSKAGGSDIDLTGDIDDELVLGGSSHGDLSRTGDSGISLLDPSDSGISLEAPPLELGGSSVESLELGEEEEQVELEPAAASAALSGIGAPAAEDDFLLTPLEEAGGEESDSGSQVIALESEVEFEDAGAAAGVSGLEQGGGVGLLEEDLGEGLGGGALETVGAAPAAGRMAAAAPAAAAGAYAMPEPVWSGWNVFSLVLCVVLLMFGGMFMYDLLRNMWSWNGPYGVNSSMMDMILSWFEK